MTPLYPPQHDMFMLVLTTSAWLAIGGLIGTCHYVTLRWIAHMLVAGLVLPVTVAVQLVRLTVVMFGPVPITVPVVVTWGLMAALALGSWIATRSLKLRPTRSQAVIELAVAAIEGQIRDTMGVAPKPYLPLIGTLFLFILGANWSSLHGLSG